MTMKSHTTKPSLLRQPLAPSILTEIRREIKNYNEEGAWMRFRFCKGDREENDDTPCLHQWQERDVKIITNLLLIAILRIMYKGTLRQWKANNKPGSASCAELVHNRYLQLIFHQGLLN